MPALSCATITGSSLRISISGMKPAGGRRYSRTSRLRHEFSKRAFGHEQQAIGLEWLFDEIIGAALDHGHRGFDIAMTRNHDDREFGMLLLEAVEQLQTIKPAAFEPNIEENEIRPARHHGGKRLVAVAGHAAAMALVLQNAGDQLADIRLIVDDQDIGCHRVRNN
jgi:hypothetical protein